MFAAKTIDTWAHQSTIEVPLVAPLVSAGTDESDGGGLTATVHVLVQGFADYIWVIVKESSSRTHGVVAHGAVAGVAGGALDVHQNTNHGDLGTASSAHETFPSDSDGDDEQERHRGDVGAQVGPSTAVPAKRPPMPPVESEVLLGSRDEALVNVLNTSLVGAIAVATGDPRPVVSCIALHSLAKALRTPAARQHAVSRILDEVAAVSSKALS